jgi:nucleotide-binding universal stress UspA family protein
MYTSILVPVDGSASAEYALAVAVALAGRVGSAVHIVHVFGERVTDALPVYGVTGSAARAATEHYVQSMADRFRGPLGGRVTGIVTEGSPAPRIVAQATQVGADPIVMASHGRTGASRFWLGSVADAVIRSAPIPVLMVRGVGGHAFARVLVPLDGSATSEAVIPHAITLARADAAAIHLLQVEEAAEDLRASVWGLAAHEPDDLANRLDRADRYLHGLIARFQCEWPPATVSAEARSAHRVGEAIAAREKGRRNWLRHGLRCSVRVFICVRSARSAPPRLNYSPCASHADIHARPS